MPLIEWSDKFSVNIKKMDKQHQKLIKILNVFDDAIEKKKEQQGITNALEDLLDYAETHFTTEEELMDQYKYPGYEQHKTSHGELYKEIIDLYKKHKQIDLHNEDKKGDEDIPTQIANLLSHWLLVHIAEEDKMYGKYLNGKGVT